MALFARSRVAVGVSRVLWISTAALVLSACFDDIVTRFPPGLEPLEPNEAPRPSEPDATLTIVDGQDADYLWVHGRGYVFASPADTWAAAKDSDVMVHVCATDDQTVTNGAEDGYEYSFEVHYRVESVVTVEWDERWRFGVVSGTAAEPGLAMVRYQKTYGSDAIGLLEGSIQILETDDPEVTEIEFVEHLDAFGGTVDDMRASMRYRYDSLKAALGDGDAPRCPD